MVKIIRLLKSNKTGASAAEYALILAVLGAVIIAGLTLLGNGINSAFTKANGQLVNGV